MGALNDIIQEHVVRNANVSISTEGWVPTQALNRTLAFQANTGALGLVAGLTALAYLLAVSCRVKNMTPGQTRMLKIIVAHVVFKTISDVPILVFALVDVPLTSWAACSYFGTFPPVAFVLSATLTYAVYLERAKATATLTTQSRAAKIVWKVCHFVVFNVPGLLILMWLSINGKIYYGKVCIQDYGFRLSTVFAVMDSTLSFGFLYLFLEPVVKHAKAMSAAVVTEPESAKKMRVVAKRNLFWASITIFTTMVYMTTVSVVAEVAATGENFHLRCLTWVLMPVCGIINMVSTLAITTGVWRPKSAPSKTSPGTTKPMQRSVRVSNVNTSTGSRLSRAASTKHSSTQMEAL